MVVYKITNNINKKIYIGQTTQKLRRRFLQHYNAGKKPKTILNRAMKKYGIKNFKIEIISMCVSKEQMNHREQYYIKVYNTLYPNGYNLTKGGDCFIFSDAIKSKMIGNKNGKGNKGQKRGPAHNKGKRGLSGERHPMYGKKHTKESIEKMSKSKKGCKAYNKREVINIKTQQKWESVKKAADFYKIKKATLWAKLSGINKNETDLLFYDKIPQSATRQD